ncbi:MAG TPA: ParB/RepB/Spo0J family partition protein [Acetobacteraceae bacterium]|nr:ParB/RepB/Spo0J family partition protein [Acetobacteraceae bacterium]
MSTKEKKPRLGMGLSALIGDVAAAPAASLSSTTAPPRAVPIEALEPGPFQARGPVSEAQLEELAASIREHGVLQPILARPKPGAPGTYQIIGGERRWRAAQLAQLHEVPVVVREFDDATAMAAGLVENLQREDLNALEEAEGLSRLSEQFGLNQADLARAVGKSRSHVANTLRLLGLPHPVKQMLRDGHLSAGHARALLGARDPGRLAGLVHARNLSVRQTEALAAADRATPVTRARAEKDPDTRDLERRLAERLGLKATVKHGARGGGELVIAYRDLDQLDGLLRLLLPDS